MWPPFGKGGIGSTPSALVGGASAAASASPFGSTTGTAYADSGTGVGATSGQFGSFGQARDQIWARAAGKLAASRTV